MPGTGSLRKRVQFKRRGEVSDGAGGYTDGFADLGSPVWCSLRPERGNERLEGGRLEANLAAVLRVRSSSFTRTMTEADQAEVDGVPYQIRSISNPDQRNKYLEMTVERGGVAQ